MSSDRRQSDVSVCVSIALCAFCCCCSAVQMEGRPAGIARVSTPDNPVTLTFDPFELRVNARGVPAAHYTLYQG